MEVSPPKRSLAVDRYRSDFGAAAYERKYTRTWFRRLDNAREHRILSRLLLRFDSPISVLNVACGAGRFGEILARWSPAATCLDFSMNMLFLCRHNLGEASADMRFIQADAVQLPFADRSFDVVLAVRLTHHIHDPSRRQALVEQLFRVARRGVIMTFTDRASPKGRLRHIRQRWFGRKRGETMIDREALFALAETQAFRPTIISPISRLFSTQVYVLLERPFQVGTGPLDRSATGPFAAKAQRDAERRPGSGLHGEGPRQERHQLLAQR
ncbi:MAG: class I SAM-dependent methyltransferase [Phycisphaerae bacterium]|nr:class I SAM-dependent methyltransferase [Phycisphaerae bacterium]